MVGPGGLLKEAQARGEMEKVNAIEGQFVIIRGFCMLGFGIRVQLPLSRMDARRLYDYLADIPCPLE